MENPLNITALNDFIFCPVSLYFHNLYGDREKTLYQSAAQLNGTKAHETVDNKALSSPERHVSMEVYCEKYNLIGKVDCYDEKKQQLTERKKHVSHVYDGYVFQLYAQYFALREMGFAVKKLSVHSMDDNKNYPVKLPEEDPEMFLKFEQTVATIQAFDFDSFRQTNAEKCAHCIYEPYCDREAQPC